MTFLITILQFNSQIGASYWMTFPLTIVNFNHFFIYNQPLAAGNRFCKHNGVIYSSLRHDFQRRAGSSLAMISIYAVVGKYKQIYRQLDNRSKK